MRCGLLLPVLTWDEANADDEDPGQTWQHRGDEGKAYRRCPGYTSSLPDVQDVAAKYRYFETGQVATVAPDAPPIFHEVMTVYDGAVSAMRGYRMKTPHPKDKG